MLGLVAGLLLLLSVQQLHSILVLRAALIKQYGAGSYRIGASALILAGLALVLIGKSSVAYIYVWLPPVWLHLFVLPLIFAAFLFVAAEIASSNIRRLTNRPVLWGVVLWSTAHLLVKGDLGSMTLFGGFGLLAALEIARSRRRGRQPTAPAVPWINEAHVVAIGGVLFIVLFYSHASLFGASASMMSRSYF